MKLPILPAGRSSSDGPVRATPNEAEDKRPGVVPNIFPSTFDDERLKILNRPELREKEAFEHYYFDIQDETAGVKMTVRFCPKGPGDPDSQIFVTYSDHEGLEYSRNISFGFDGFEYIDSAAGTVQLIFSTDNSLTVLRGPDNRIASYALKVAVGTLTAGLECVTLCEGLKPEQDGRYLRSDDRKDYNAIVFSAPWMAVTGTIACKGKTKKINGSGNHDHSWGTVSYLFSKRRWYWGRFFTRDEIGKKRFFLYVKFFAQKGFEQEPKQFLFVATEGRFEGEMFNEFKISPDRSLTAKGPLFGWKIPGQKYPPGKTTITTSSGRYAFEVESIGDVLNNEGIYMRHQAKGKFISPEGPSKGEGWTEYFDLPGWFRPFAQIAFQIMVWLQKENKWTKTPALLKNIGSAARPRLLRRISFSHSRPGQTIVPVSPDAMQSEKNQRHLLRISDELEGLNLDDDEIREIIRETADRFRDGWYIRDEAPVKVAVFGYRDADKPQFGPQDPAKTIDDLEIKGSVDYVTARGGLWRMFTETLCLTPDNDFILGIRAEHPYEGTLDAVGSVVQENTTPEQNAQYAVREAFCLTENLSGTLLNTGKTVYTHGDNCLIVSYLYRFSPEEYGAVLRQKEILDTRRTEPGGNFRDYLKAQKELKMEESEVSGSLSRILIVKPEQLYHSAGGFRIADEDGEQILRPTPDTIGRILNDSNILLSLKLKIAKYFTPMNSRQAGT